ncbi:MAG: hypothetical protein EZS28_020411 [Streblomastix strix]|uniref:Uncharacterized protein n=1 Tax=Streblomastix strix TaxID=222440 RepID=A0A5J4VP74_9EUKA|nr:MAG: hypothetical protein EZS28_020411 [Streblomastix strix]
MPDRKGKFLHPTSRVALAKKELFKYYNVKREDQHKFLINYPGFDFATDAEEISRRLNLNINIYQYVTPDQSQSIMNILQNAIVDGTQQLAPNSCCNANRDKDIHNSYYSLERQHSWYQLLCSYHNTEINDNDQETDKNSNIIPRELLQSKIASNPTEFNILLVTDDCGNSHIMYIADINGLLGIKICPICKVHAIPAHDKYSHVKRKMDAHMKKCKENKQLLLENTHLKLEYDGQIIKRVVLEKYPKPYAPHILQNKSYKYLLANNRVNELKPIKFYITYKFFTLDRKVNKKCGEFSFQHANLEPLCVASTIKTKKEIKTIYFDNRTVNFIDEWLKLLFEEAKQVKIDNKYQDENIPQCFDVPVLGWDSSKFDTSLIFRNLHSNQYVISKYIGSGAHPKQIVVRNTENSVTLKFIDVKSYLAPNMEYDAFIKDIGKVVLNQPVFPEEYLNCDNYQTELDKSEAFPMQSFINQLKNSSISISEYNNYIKMSESFVSRWDYMRHCIEQDTQMMLHPIDNMINFYFEFKVDMLLNTSLAKNSCQVKYSFVYKDFDLQESYNDVITNDDDSIVNQFILTPQYWQMKVNDYNEQDKRQKRDRKHNITIKDYEYFKKLFITHTCHMCQSRFNYKNKPTLDRIDNNIAHTKANVLPCCLYCNKYASNRDKNEARLMIQLRRFALKYGLPMTISDQQVYKLCRRDLTGGISYVAHRENIAGQTKINKFIYERASNTVHSFDLPHVMTHVYSLDFNSLYASVMSSEQHQSIPYTNHRLYMPGYVLERIDNDQQRMRNIIYNEYRFSSDEQLIDKHVQLFIAEIKAHIHDDYINDQIDLPVIWRNLTITTSEQDIGKYTYKQLIDNGMQHDIEERKLTMISSTHGQYMSFSNYYLWLLIDRFHLIIDEIRFVTTFSKHCQFNEFVNIFVNRRCKAIQEGNQSMNQLCKLTLNTSFGYDSLNTEKYQNIKLCNKDNIRQTHLLGTFVSEKQLSDNLYAVQLQPYNCSCSTPLQVAYFTMDNAKYYYLNTYYNFIMQTIDVNKIHYVYGDTDSMCFAVAGNEAAGIHQGLKYVINDQQLYNETYYQFLPRDAESQDVYDEKKINGLTVQSEGSACIALAAKCYYICTDEQPVTNQSQQATKLLIKLKGVNQKQNQNIDFQKSFHTSIDSNAITTVENTSLIQKNGIISRITQNKIGISGVNTKAIVLQNQSCAPYLHGVPASNYVIDNEL